MVTRGYSISGECRPSDLGDVQVYILSCGAIRDQIIISHYSGKHVYSGFTGVCYDHIFTFSFIVSEEPSQEDFDYLDRITIGFTYKPFPERGTLASEDYEYSERPDRAEILDL